MKTLRIRPNQPGPDPNNNRISPRTGRPVRRYDDSISTTVRALNFDERAIRKLLTKWPDGAKCGDKLEPWPNRLSAIFVAVLAEGWHGDPLLTYTPPDQRDLQHISRRAA